MISSQRLWSRARDELVRTVESIDCGRTITKKQGLLEQPLSFAFFGEKGSMIYYASSDRWS